MLDFLICYEHINREIENISLLKYELNKRGYSCEIMHFNGPGFFKNSRYKNRANVVVTPWLRDDENVYHFLQLVRKKGKIVNLQWEQVYCEEDLTSGLCETIENATKAYHLCWGINSKKRLIKAGVNPKNLSITGAIQLDFGRHQFANYYQTREKISEQYQLNLKKPWILFISSFAYTNYNKDDLKKLEEMYGEHIRKLFNMHKQSMGMTLKWIEKLLNDYECEFIYRPHPSELVNKDLVDLENKYENFKIISDYSVKQWISVCDKINIWISTSNAEITFMGKDYNIVRPMMILQELEVETMKEEHFITNYDDFIKANMEQLSIEQNDERRKKLKYYYDYGEKASYIRVADCLEKILRDPIRQRYNFMFGQRAKLFYIELRKKVVSAITEIQIVCKINFINYLPIKKEIKENLNKRVSNYHSARELEKKIIKYMEEHEYEN